METAQKSTRKIWKFQVRQNSLKNAIEDTLHHRIVRTNYIQRSFREKKKKKKHPNKTADDRLVLSFFANVKAPNDSGINDLSESESESDSDLESESDSDSD